MTEKHQKMNPFDNEDNAGLENAGRRKAVKTIVGGVTAIAAYHALPVKWGTPIIEQVFLPAHAATSGAYTIGTLDAEYRIGDSTTSSITVKVSGFVSPSAVGVPVSIVVTPVEP